MFADQRHAAFKVTWNVYQTELPTKEKKIMTQLITSLHSSIPTGLQKLRSLGQTMTRHRDDILAFSSTTPAPATAPPRPSRPDTPTVTYSCSSPKNEPSREDDRSGTGRASPRVSAVIQGASIVRRYLVFQRPDDDRKVFAYLLPIALLLVLGEVYEGCLDLPLPTRN